MDSLHMDSRRMGSSLRKGSSLRRGFWLHKGCSPWGRRGFWLHMDYSPWVHMDFWLRKDLPLPFSVAAQHIFPAMQTWHRRDCIVSTHFWQHKGYTISQHRDFSQRMGSSRRKDFSLHRDCRLIS